MIALERHALIDVLGAGVAFGQQDERLGDHWQQNAIDHEARTVSFVSSVVCSPRTTSTNFITGTGLKEFIPTNRPGRQTGAASRVVEIDEVFVAITVPERTAASTA